MSAFAKGDRVVVESPVRLPHYDTASTRRSLGVNVPVGTLATVDFVDTDGEVFIKSDGGRESYIDPEGLLKVDDLDRLAAVRAPMGRLVVSGSATLAPPTILGARIPGIPNPAEPTFGTLRALAARTAREILGTDALVDDVIALAKFLLDD